MPLTLYKAIYVVLILWQETRSQDDNWQIMTRKTCPSNPRKIWC